MRFAFSALRPAALWPAALLAASWLGCGGTDHSPHPIDSGILDGGHADAALLDAALLDAAPADAANGGPDASRPECEFGGAPGKCMTASACTAIADHSSEPGTCATGLGCCIDTPDITDNPAIPAGYKLMMQSQVTPAMTAWAVMILHDPVTYPMYATAMRTFGALMVLARVQWHPPDFQNSVVHRGVTLFVPM